MKWDSVNRWLTLGANIGVLVGIILILTELDQNADLMRAQMSQSRSDSITARYADMMHSDYWPAIEAKRMKGGKPGTVGRLPKRRRVREGQVLDLP